MKRILPYCLILAATTASLAAAQDQVPWAPDYPTACKAAESSNRLVLLHFFSDDCPPCRVVETQVFTQPQVAAAIAKNYVPLKVHARLAPELARRYQVDRWPTDVIVTPGGLEVQRSISPQSPEQYIAFVDAVATTSGTAARRWASNMQQAGQATLTQATATANRYSTEAQQNWGQAAGQFNAAADQAQKNVFQLSQQAQDAARQYGQQTQTAVQGFRQETQNAVQQYQQQAEGAAQFAQQQVNATSQQWQNQITSTGQQLEQQATAARNQFQSAGSQAQDAALQFGAQAQAAAGQFYAGASDLRAPTYPSQSAAPPANVGQFGQPVGQFGQTNSSQPLAAAAAAGVPQPASIQNPYAAQPSPPVGGSQGPSRRRPRPLSLPLLLPPSPRRQANRGLCRCLRRRPLPLMAIAR
jgi:thiol-disulfide isomerase/thioredoxin